MNTELKEKIEVYSRYIHISIPFYADDYIFSSNDYEKYPLVTDDERWEVTIDLKKHILQEWKTEFGSCHIFSKVRDEGKYTLLDKDKKALCQLIGYVPNGVIPPKNGYNDYIEFNIAKDGSVSGWYDSYDFIDFIERGKVELSERMISITGEQHIWDVLNDVFIPLSLNIFHELRGILNSHFAYHSEYVYLSESHKRDEELFPIDIEESISRLKEDSRIQKHITYTKSLWLSYGASSPKQRDFGTLNFLIVYHIEFWTDYYYLPILNRNIPYGVLPTTHEINIILQTLKDTTVEIINTRKNGITEF
ncbi:hypothetical protein QR305_02769 [Bacteroides finegoldii]|uniref:Uncharacterized protein n=1 Tax=Bacteroides finegoldii CL09T03C10 TaxID=997888 RepID=K5CSX2_9BACE|nr:hypothetical protein [Bacteroides finegoldii]EKJ92510.1 hypothetical protein HMPREF1057_01345 [Bacteroides finegoldii CL09T03C10]